MSENFDPKKIIDFNKDYYFILGITETDLPKATDRQNKLQIAQIIEKSYRKMARKCHPDFGGSNEQFLDLIRARRILEDPYLRKIYDQKYFEDFTLKHDDKNEFNVDWNKIGTYRKGTPEDTLGFSFFLRISEKKDIYNITPAFFPELNEHNYEWDWVINESKNKLVLSIVNDENEVLRLTSSQFIDESLPYKIYICIPNNNLNFVRNNKSIVSPDGKTLINGSINSISYKDINLLETTSLQEAEDYIQNKLQNDLKSFINGELAKINNSEHKWLDTQEIKKYDKTQLQNILNMKSFEFLDNQNASNFLDDLKDENLVSNEDANKPELPI